MTRAVLISAAAGAIAMCLAGIATSSTATAIARLTLLGAALGAVAYVDLREHRIPNRVVLPAAIACGALLLAERVNPAELLPALAVVAVLLIVSLIAPAALGMGDVKLALLLALGLSGDSVAAIAAGFALAALYSVVLLARHGPAARSTALPLGPFLAGGAFLTATLA